MNGLARYTPAVLRPAARRLYRIVRGPRGASLDARVGRLERALAKAKEDIRQAKRAAASAEAAAKKALAAARPAEVAYPPLDASKAMRSRDELHAYWRNPDDANRAVFFADQFDRSMFLLDLLRPYVSTDDRILEIGPNVGRNLEQLRRAGFSKLEGIEINAEAVELMRTSFPELAQVATVHVAPVEEVIRDLPDRAFGAVFTMAVLEHIHPDSEWIFGEMTRVSRDVIVTIEDERSETWRHAARDYQTIFEGLGMVQVVEGDPSDIPGFGRYFRARVFRHAAGVGAVASAAGSRGEPQPGAGD